MLLLFLHHHVGLSARASCGARLLGLGVLFGGAYLRTLLDSPIADHLVVVLHHYVLSCGLKFAGAAPVPLMAAEAGRLPRLPAGLSHSLHPLFAICFGDPVVWAHF
jgi:hypothetical protein